MVNYKCIRCGYTTNDKSKMKAHFRRKTICKPELNDINIDEYKNDILEGKKIVLKPKSPKHPKTSQIIPLHPETSQNIPKAITNSFICRYCNKSYKALVIKITVSYH